MKLGARIFKTGISIVLALFIAHLISRDGAVVAGISALFAVQPSVYRSFRTVIEQFQGNIIGAILAVVMAQLFGYHIFIIGLTSIILISLLAKIKLQHVAGLAVVTQLVIMDHQGDSFYETALMRFALVMVGVLSASIVNMLFLPPKYETKLYYNTMNICGDIFKWIRLTMNGTSEFHVVKKDLDDIRSRIVKVESQFDLYKEERAYTKKHAYQNLRKKILFKEMIFSTRRAYDLLRKINRYENEILHLPEELKIQIKLELDELMTYHEEILMRISNKVSMERTADMSALSEKFEDDLLDAFINEIRTTNEPYDSKQRIFQVIGAMVEYEESLEHLDVLTHSFYKYHQDDSKISIEEENLDI